MRPSRLPHGIEPRVIDLDQWSCLQVFTEVKPQSLEDLETACAGFGGPFDFIGLKPGIAWLVSSGPPRLGTDQEPVRVRLVPVAEHVVQCRAVAASDVDHHANVHAVHQRQHVFRPGRHAGLRPFRPLFARNV